jgi:5-deoxy-glucuronate isomerase
MMANLLVKPGKPQSDGCIHRITPATAGWEYVGFEVYQLTDGQRIERETAGTEACLVLVSGRADISAAGQDFGKLGQRQSPFDGSPWSVYVPPGVRWSVVADGTVEFAVCLAPAKTGVAARIIPPTKVGQETRGTGTNTRHVRNILPEHEPAESLLVVEVITPGGHWSSYPPHKHDRNALPAESYLEEIYYHRLARPTGFALQRVYTGDRSLDETMAVADRDVVLVPRGYHPVGAPHGYDLWYLNVMAGPQRTWRFCNDPEHEWLIAQPISTAPVR